MYWGINFILASNVFVMSMIPSKEISKYLEPSQNVFSGLFEATQNLAGETVIWQLQDDVLGDDR
jgi:hypothetical protein